MVCHRSIWSFVFFFKQKTAYEMRISDWSSDVCSSDLRGGGESCAIAGPGWLPSRQRRGQVMAACGRRLPLIPFVIPANAGTQGWASLRALWVPAFAGTTKNREWPVVNGSGHCKPLLLRGGVRGGEAALR